MPDPRSVKSIWTGIPPMPAVSAQNPITKVKSSLAITVTNSDSSAEERLNSDSLFFR